MSGESLQLEGLISLIDQRNEAAAKEYIENIVNFFDKTLTNAEFDLALEKLFNSTNGTVAFLNKSIAFQKNFQSCNVNIFTLWHNLLLKFSSSTNFVPYGQDIADVCLKFMTASIGPSAKERERATIVLKVLIECKVVTEDFTISVLNRCLTILNLKKPTEMFTYEIFRTIGLISKLYPVKVSDLQHNRIKHEYLKAMDTVINNQQEVRFHAVCGALEGFKDYLEFSAQTITRDPDTLDRIYSCLKKLSTPSNDIRQKSAFRAAIELFTSHSTLFSKQIFRDSKHWQQCIETWITSSIYEDRRRGVYASYALHQIIANGLKEDSSDDSKETFRFMLSEFRRILESPNSRPEETRIAIKGFGTMSLLCKRFLPDILNAMISLVIQRCELILLADDNTMRDVLNHFPDYIQALSTVVKELKDPQISEVLTETLKNVIIRLIRDFHFLPAVHYTSVTNSISNAFQSIYLTDVALFERLTSRVIFEGIVWTCSHRNAFDAATDSEEEYDWKDKVSFKSYRALWHALLSSEDQSSPEKIAVANRIYTCFITTLLNILDKLDLRTQKRIYTAEDGTDQEFYICDPNFDLCPMRPKDFHIFNNIVDFYRDLWPQFRQPQFKYWIEAYCDKIAKLLQRHPLVSGFLKLLEMGLEICVFLNTSQNISAGLVFTLAHVFKLMIVRCQRISGELQISTLELLFQFPVSFYDNHLLEMIPVFETAFELGKSMSWLAHAAMECLEKISLYSRHINLKNLLAKVLPLLDAYLQGHCGVEQLSIREGKGGNKLCKPKWKKRTHYDAHDIQTKIVSYLGKMPFKVSSLLVLNSVQDQDLVKWDSQKCIHLDLRMPDINPVVYLDTLIPRICHLALTSTDRHIKVASCEIVHALVLYLIGARANHDQIWKELCKRMLLLGCDGDETVQQMFEPLLLQVMHFMSKYENLDRGVGEMMDAIMNGICSKSNLGLRDLSASCLREFVEWSFKQTSPQQLAASPVSIEIILGKLKMFCFDSDACKRVGAALAFNNLYRLLREKEYICDVFFVDLLHTFCINLKLSEELTTLPPSENINSDFKTVSDALDHVVRVLSERNYLFNKPSEKRLVPSALNSGTLFDVVKFLVTQTGAGKVYYRQKCMSLVDALAPKIDGVDSVEHFFQSVRFSDDELLEICEGAQDGAGIRSRPSISFMLRPNHTVPEKVIYTWLEYVLRSLECYAWFLREKAITTKSCVFQKSNILSVALYYMDELCYLPLSAILRANTPEHTMVQDLETEVKVTAIKSLINVNIFNFLTEYVRSKCSLMNPNFWDFRLNTNLMMLTMQILHEPTMLSINPRVHGQIKNSAQYIDRFCDALKEDNFYKKLSSNMFHEISRSLGTKLELLFITLVEAFKATDTRFHHFCSDGIMHILKYPNIDEIIEMNQPLISQTAEKIARKCFGEMRKTVSNTLLVANHDEISKKFATYALIIAFSVHDLSSMLVDFILDPTELATNVDNVKIKEGYAIFERYEIVINEHVSIEFFKKCFAMFSRRTKEEQDYLLRVLTGVLKHRLRAQSDASGKFAEIIEYCIQNLPLLLNSFTKQSEDFHFIEYLSVLASVPLTDFLTINQRVPEIGKWIIAKLRSPQLNLEKKCKFISLLPILVGAADYENHDVMSALEELQCRHFPLKSTEFSRNSLEETSLKHAFIILLNALVASKSYVVLEFLFKSTAADENHLMENEIHKGVKTFALCLSKDEQVEVLKRTFEVVLNDTHEPLLRLTIFRRFLLNIFKHSTEEALMEFMQKVIKRVDGILEANYRVSNAGRAVEQALINRIIGFGLVEYFVGTVRKELYSTVECPVAIELLGTPKTPSEFVGIFTKKAFYVRTEEFTTPSKDAAELFRQYQCSAYSALCSLVSNTQTELKFYSKFLFEENSRKNEFIWARLVDCSVDKNYLYPCQEQEEHMKIRKRFVAIRKLDVQPVVSLKSITTAKGFQTQNIMESSLSQDIHAIDLTSHSIRSQADALRRQEIRSVEAMSVHLESNDLNKHEVMPMLCGVIRYMHANNITPVITDITVKRSYPWVQAIASAIESIDYHRNVRVFLSQVVDNCSYVFQQFAHVLFKPLLRMLVDECGGDKLNFFITDIVALLISWTTKKLHTPKEGEIHLINDLLKFLMKNTWSEKKEIFKFNLELVQTMLSVWKDCIKVPSNLLLEMITRTERKDSKANECGVIMLGMILSNDLTPWIDNNKILYINAILSNTENEFTSIYQPAAFALGAFPPALCREGDQASADNLLAEIKSRLQALNSKKDHKSEKRFMDILYNVHRSSPKIVDGLCEVICFKIPTAVGVTKRNYMEMVLSRIESFDEDEVYNIIIGIGIKDLLKHTDYQLLALHILNRSIPMLKTHDIKDLFKLVKESLQLKDPQCRDIAYEVCIYIAQNYATDLRAQAVGLLFKAVSDPNVEIQKRIYQFWSKDVNMSPNIVERLTELLRSYASNGEPHFLGLCTQLILDPIIESPDVKKQIFAFEDDREAKLHEYQIKTKSLRRQKYTVPPLFTECFSPRTSMFKSTQFCSLVGSTNADYVFEPTQDPRSVSQARQNFTLQSQSSIPFQIATQVLNRRSEKVAVENKAPTSPNALRKRFVKDTEKGKSDATVRIIQVKERKKEQANLMAKDNSVNLYRRYRYGDYPDLLINNLAFLLPLQALARRDVLVAKDLFVAVCTGILEAVESDSTAFFREFNDIFQIVLRNSSVYEPTTVSAFFELSLLKPGAFTLQPEKVAKVAKLTKNLTLGALYLEERLNADWDEDNCVQQETKHWLQLSDIYNSLKEYEVVSAIFSDKMRTDPRLAEAIDLKANGRADEAQKLLVDVIGRNMHTEHYYAFNCYYECSTELGQWSHLTQAIENEIDNWEELWTDEYNMNFLLPKYLQGKLQLMLAGNKEDQDFIKSCLDVPQKFKYVKTELCEEGMMLLILGKNYHQARVMYEDYMKTFLRDWSIASSYHIKTKLETLFSVQRVAELYFYATVFLDIPSQITAQNLIAKWKAIAIDLTQSLHGWSSVIGYRKYVGKFCHSLLQTQQGQVAETLKELMTHVHNFDLTLFNAALAQKNFALSQAVYERLRPPSSTSPLEALTSKISTIKNTYLQSERMEKGKRQFEPIWNTLNVLLNDDTLTAYPMLQLESLHLKSKILRDMVKMIELQHFDQLPEESLRSITGLRPTDDLKICLIKLAVDTLKDESWLALRTSSFPSIIRNNSLLNLARFCYDRLSYIESGTQMSRQLQKLFINSVMRGMSRGYKDAVQLFPCVLQLRVMGDALLQEYFRKLSADVPVWTYLPWIPQILSRMQLTQPSYLDEIVLKIAVKFPEALRYPFAIWHREAKFQLSLTKSMADYNDRSAIAAISERLHHKLNEKFVRSFKYLAIPEAYLSAELESFERDIRNHSQITQQQFKNLATRLIEDVYCEEVGFQGDAYRRLLKYKTDLQNLKDLSFDTDEERIRKTLVDVAQSLRGYLRKTHSLTIETSVQLENLCPWLGSYQWCGEEDSIELPGQYAQMSWNAYPIAKEHTKIVRFNSKIRVLVSQRYPLRITVNGSNGRSYDFLVKHGEDLKQDQRIQQILELMSEKLRGDRNCQGHNLFIRTYQAVPVDRNCGLLSWVTNTVSLHDLILNCFSRRCPNSNEIIEQTTRNYLEFIGRPSHASPNTSNLTVYGTAASRYSRDQLIQNQRELENRIDHDILKKALLDLALSPASYFALRNNFATSLAAMNIAHWILGVGDRHLQNILISTKDGTVTGIDFGFTFGSGTRDQKVPELTPFRLTPHLVNVMSPLGTSGLIYKSMVNALKVFRKYERILLACMDVFIHEPSVNWLDTAMSRMSVDDDVILRAWEPKDRIDIARCKLQGFNPMYLFGRELNVGLISKNIEFLAGYMKILRGHMQFNERSRLGKNELTAEQQVNCLIDQATDPAILGISYVGFAPWI